ncbi:MAG TPA: DNA repair protein RecO [Niabella sp.]|nr:DNA repair protein RecO [Niabella sp.]HOZ96525.1 DNA repair protein RecO [Niabella sp.]HQW13294.1 DNA repair protein RecO [Niabella sp.]HQX18666.1 DNA repair protein RecO [Niabella sp.]HQX40319.1 DNA repair protein RecO [Niabella sp.]
MSDLIHKTKGIVLKTVKYGETSVIVSVYTELFGLQSYLINGVRTSGKKGAGKMSFFQSAAILEMEVYHNELKQINRVKEFRFAYLYQDIFYSVIKNGVALYMVELLTKCLSQPEVNFGLYAFVEDCLMELDTCTGKEMANFPIFFAVHLSNFFGFLPAGISEDLLKSNQVLFDVQEGIFTDTPIAHGCWLDTKPALVLAEIALVRQPGELTEISTNAEIRRGILEVLELYYSFHISGFGKMKTLPVLKAIMS